MCYLGESREASFVETFLRRPPVRLLSRAFLDERLIAELTPSRAIRVVNLYGPGLARVGATAAVASGPYNASQAWARAIWEHPSQPDGLLYRCRHDDNELALALYDRAASAVDAPLDVPIRADTLWFGSVLDRYRLGLDD